MAEVKLKISELEDLFFEGAVEKDGVTFEIVEEGDWTHDHKHQYANLIFTDGERNYRGSIGRSGSEWTDWTYDSEIYGDADADVVEVEKKEIVKYAWVAVKK